VPVQIASTSMSPREAVRRSRPLSCRGMSNPSLSGSCTTICRGSTSKLDSSCCNGAIVSFSLGFSFLVRERCNI
jgi:hypothetical protein